MYSMWILLLIGSSAFAAPQYQFPDPAIPFPPPCPEGSRGLPGCDEPQPELNFYSFDAPPVSRPALNPVDIPKPKVRHNIVFIEASDDSQQQDPIIIPQSQEKTLVYVLNKKQQQQQQQIQLEDTPALKPEVYYVHYDEGDNVDLPGGYNLQSALASARSQQGQLIEGIGNAGSSGVQDVPSFIGGNGALGYNIAPPPSQTYSPVQEIPGDLYQAPRRG